MERDEPSGSGPLSDLSLALGCLLKSRRTRASGADGTVWSRRAIELLIEGSPNGCQLTEPQVKAVASDSMDEHEAVLETLLGKPSQRLAAYGSLRPGERHHDQVASLAGSWERGEANGRLGELDGYPVLYWDPGGPPVEVSLLRSSLLSGYWNVLDEFEGVGYLRAYVPVKTLSGTLVASCYLAREEDEPKSGS